MSNTLPPLPYDYDALEPYISKQIMTLHHTKHHQTYVNALNAAEASYARLLPEGAHRPPGCSQVQRRWPHQPLALLEELAPAPAKGGNGGVLKDGPLKAAIDKDFGGLENLKKEFNAATLGIQGSGWGWLGLNPATKRLEIATTPNQDPLLHLVPVIGVDIWEHAFYLQYLNVKPDYLNAIWNVINFEEAEKRMLEASKL
ncbi:manganese superoxide dismutase [Mycena leptocephala]|nr:manganese superoxide dismutase [Mycena leptocephala]